MPITRLFPLFCGRSAATLTVAAGFGGALLLLPALTFTVGARAAVPILTVAQFLGNLSRAGFGRREIRWRPALLFGVGAVSASVIGSRPFVDLPASLLIGSAIGDCVDHPGGPDLHSPRPPTPEPNARSRRSCHAPPSD